MRNILHVSSIYATTAAFVLAIFLALAATIDQAAQQKLYGSAMQAGLVATIGICVVVVIAGAVIFFRTQKIER